MLPSELKIGQQVLVVPLHYNKDLPAPKTTKMYVRELHDKNCAGLSHKPKSKGIYGILYEIIHPL